MVEARINSWYLGMAEGRVRRTAVAGVLVMCVRWKMYIVVRLRACAVVDLHDSARDEAYYG